jgi:predicted carbohydrate-binding protein with CBM48
MWNDDMKRRRAAASGLPGDGGRDEAVWNGEVEAETDAALQRLAAAVRQRAPALDADLDRRVMAAIRRSPRWYLRAALRWWLCPRPVPISPFGALATAAALAALLLAVVRYVGAPAGVAARSGITAGSAPATASGVRVVRFVLAAPSASRVNVVGDFNGWDTGATPLRPVGAAGVWTVEVPLTPGRHEYAFLIDGREWRPDPTTPRAAADDYGSPNSVIVVGAHST